MWEKSGMEKLKDVLIDRELSESDWLESWLDLGNEGEDRFKFEGFEDS